MPGKTLADFARSIGITPELARQWKRRGRIVEVEDGFVLDAGVTLGSVTLGAEIGDGSGVRGKVVATGRDGVTVKRDSVTADSIFKDSRLCRREDSAGGLNPESHLESLNSIAADSESYDPETISGADCDPRPRYHIALEERLERDNYALSREIELLKDLAGDLARRVVALERVERENATLQGLIDGLRARVSGLEALNPAVRLVHSDRHATAIDPPGPNWGA